MADYIDKWKLLEYIEDEIRNWDIEYDVTDILADIEDFPEINLPERHGKWRPFDPDDKSTWPEDYCEVLATVSDWNDVLIVLILCFNQHEKSWRSDIGFDLEIDEVTAWTPLPAPYEPEVET